MSVNPDDLENKNTPRERKLEKRIHPRERRIIKQAIKKQIVDSGKNKRTNEAKKEIAKILANFENLKASANEKQKEIYVRWIKDSLAQNSPIMDDGDIHIDTALASVGAGGQNMQKNRTSVRLTHIPTRISVKNEEERNLEQNKENAKNKLLDRLSQHLFNWQTLASELPAVFSISEINRLGVQILDLFESTDILKKK